MDNMNGFMIRAKPILYLFIVIFVTNNVVANDDFKNSTDTIQYLDAEVNDSDLVVNNHNTFITLNNETQTYVENGFLHKNHTMTITACISNITGVLVEIALGTITVEAINDASLSGFNDINSLIKSTLKQNLGSYDILFTVLLKPGTNLNFVSGEGSIAVNKCWPINEGGTAGTVCVVGYPAKGPSDICTEPAESSASHIWHTGINIFVTLVTVLLNVLR